MHSLTNNGGQQSLCARGSDSSKPCSVSSGAQPYTWPHQHALLCSQASQSEHELDVNQQGSHKNHMCSYKLQMPDRARANAQPCSPPFKGAVMFSEQKQTAPWRPHRHPTKRATSCIQEILPPAWRSGIQRHFLGQQPSIKGLRTIHHQASRSGLAPKHQAPGAAREIASSTRGHRTPLSSGAQRRRAPSTVLRGGGWATAS